MDMERTEGLLQGVVSLPHWTRTGLVTDEGGAIPLLGAVAGSTYPESAHPPWLGSCSADFPEVISNCVFLIGKRSPGPGTLSAPGTSLSRFPQHSIFTGARGGSYRVWILGKFAQEAGMASNGERTSSLSRPLLPLSAAHLPCLLPCAPLALLLTPPAHPSPDLHPCPSPLCGTWLLDLPLPAQPSSKSSHLDIASHELDDPPFSKTKCTLQRVVSPISRLCAFIKDPSPLTETQAPARLAGPSTVVSPGPSAVPGP